MEKKDFLKQLRGFFSEKGFSNKGNHYYKALNDETVIVFGLQFTAYGGALLLFGSRVLLQFH